MTSSSLPQLALVVPCFNEQAGLAQTVKKLSSKMEHLKSQSEISTNSFVLFVDDGSRDDTWSIIESAHTRNSTLQGLRLAKNVGHQNALLAGLMEVRDRCDCAISIDADLQQDINAIPKFLARYQEGAQIVFGVRNTRNTDSWFKKITALGFYRLMHIMGVRIIKNHADYRLMSKKALNTLSDYHESNLFLRGLVTDIGFKTAIVNFDVFERTAGSSQYSLVKMLTLALNGITSFSVVPLRITQLLGIIILILSVLMFIWILFASISGRAVPGWTSTVAPIYLIGGVQILSLGLIGEYIGKIYSEVKHRPRYTIDEKLTDF